MTLRADIPPEAQGAAVKSARRVVEVLEHFDRVQCPQSLTEIALALGYPASSTLALLKSLLALEYLSYDFERRTYSPTMRVAMLGAWVQACVFRDGVLVRLMEALQEATGETVVLGMQNDLHVQYIHVVQARHLLRYHLHPGTFRPIHSTAAGRMLLAHQSRDAIARLVRQLDRRAGVTLDLGAFWDGLQEVRAAGYAWSANQVTEGAGTMAVLAPKMADGRATVLGVAGPLSRLEPNRERILASLRSIVGPPIVDPKNSRL
ncbi:Pectin degradation repressor protein KdgR [Methylobacterium brachiatum]|nr:Pectin degradation repressor protein KdgR [Methylobacterium brachiatum]